MSEVKKIKVNENVSGQRPDNFLINELKEFRNLRFTQLLER